ncbi:MAG TPA: imidazole glycerol phosphate synthase subunit HisH [Hyphomicrobiaceae bacterium]|nr:imidazole glycerol phosphate synthase subunit HisH [Hyphomicrobiaceae bacterium]
MRVAIIDYGSGNLRSAEKALERAAKERGIRAEIAVTADPDELRLADRIVLPGVGAFRDCRNGLYAISGMHACLDDEVRQKGKPFLGICVGMQLMATKGLEFGETPGLDWIGGAVRRIKPVPANLKVPHMGWNSLNVMQAHPVLAGMNGTGQAPHAYFVHSYEFVPDDPATICATADYGGTLVAVVAKDNMAGTQFHPEKSQAAGLNLLGNFLEWRP